MQFRKKSKSERFTIRIFGTPAASRLVVILGAWSVFWVVCSDYILSLFVEAPPVLWNVEWAEGAIYVSVSGVVVSFLIRQMQQENERDRRANESKLRSLQAAGLIGIFTWRNGAIIDANDAFLRMLAYTKEDLTAGGLSIATLTAPEYHVLEAEARRELDEKGCSRIFQAELIGKNGDRVAVVGGRARIEGQDHYGIGYALDITPLVAAQKEQKQLEEQLHRADRLTALGRLAGGIAHDFNNLLGVIIGYAVLAQAGTGNDIRRESVEEVLKAAAKAKELIRKLLAFSQKHVLHPALLDVNAALREFSAMLSRLLGDTCELRLELDEQAGCVFADSTEIEQVVMNLVVNARDAMPRGGVITIATDKVHIAEESSAFESVPSGDYVAIRVRDAGQGIDPGILDQIFEPFFSTKVETGGTGLGLSIVYGLVRQHGGHVRVRSRVQEGTEFTLLFPWAANAAAPAGPPAASTLERGTETILVAEDLEEMRRMLAILLGSLGYTVLTAEDGQRAIEVAREYTGEIHLVVADVGMPRLSGPEATAQIRRERPQIKVVLITGFADSELLQGKSAPDAAIVEKPIAPEILASKIREVLGPRRQENQ